MKPIYINQKKSHKNKIVLALIALLVVFFICVKLFLSPILEAAINRSGSDGKGYHFKIKDLDLKILKGEVFIGKMEVFNHKNAHTFLDAKDVELGFNPFNVMGAHKVFSLKVDVINAIISKDFSNEVKRVKNETKETKDKAQTDVYIEKITADVRKLNVRHLEEDKSRTLITFNNLQTTIKDLGLGKPKKETTIQLTSGIEGGGQIELHGKTKIEKGNTPWTFNGKLKKITPTMIEMLAGEKFPFEAEAPNFDASINAHSEGAAIVGEITPKIKELRIKADAKDSALKRNIAKATNYLMKKIEGQNDEFTIALPFTLDENFKLDLEDSWNKFRNSK